MSDEIREEAIQTYSHLVDKAVSYFSKKFPYLVSKEDLRSAGYIGLLKAIENYDPTSNVKFATYAYGIVKGEILHLIRYTMRQLGININEYERLRNKLEDFHTLQSYGLHVWTHIPLSSVVQTEDEMLPFEETLPDNQSDPVNFVIAMDMLEVLTERERDVAILVSQGYSIREISELLNISPQRVTQIKKNIRKKWKEFL